MGRFVMKFGGTSVSSLRIMRQAALRVVQAVRAGHEITVVVSAMAGETGRLISMVKRIEGLGELGETEADYEYASVVSSGEQVAAGLMALTLQSLGLVSRSYLGWQLPIRTNSCAHAAEVGEVDVQDLDVLMKKGGVPVVTGFQGSDAQGRLTVLRRGGSDLTAVVLTRFLKASICELYTDVDGVFTADPTILPQAVRIYGISYQEMLELSSLGALVVQSLAVEYALRYTIPIRVLSAFAKHKRGTWIVENRETLERLQ